MFGEPGGDPEGFWFPALGGYCGLLPGDLGDLTPGQLMDCFDYLPKREA